MSALFLPLLATVMIGTIEVERLRTSKDELQKHLDAAVVACAGSYENTREQGSSWRDCSGVRFGQAVRERMVSMKLSTI